MVLNVARIFSVMSCAGVLALKGLRKADKWMLRRLFGIEICVVINLAEVHFRGIVFAFKLGDLTSVATELKAAWNLMSPPYQGDSSSRFSDRIKPRAMGPPRGNQARVIHS